MTAPHTMTTETPKRGLPAVLADLLTKAERGQTAVTTLKSGLKVWARVENGERSFVLARTEATPPSHKEAEVVARDAGWPAQKPEAWTSPRTNAPCLIVRETPRERQRSETPADEQGLRLTPVRRIPTAPIVTTAECGVCAHWIVDAAVPHLGECTLGWDAHDGVHYSEHKKKGSKQRERVYVGHGDLALPVTSAHHACDAKLGEHQGFARRRA